MQRTTWIGMCGTGVLGLALSMTGGCGSDSSPDNDAGSAADSGTGPSGGGATNGGGGGNGGQLDAGQHGGGGDGGSAGGTPDPADAGGGADDAGGGAGGNNGANDACSAAKPTACDFVVGVVKKDKTHPWNGMGFGSGYVVDGVQGKMLSLTRGTAYTFLLGQSCNHPFYIGTSETGGTGSPGKVTAGISLAGASACDGAVLTYTPPAGAPGTLYYQCDYHLQMGGTIKIGN